MGVNDQVEARAMGIFLQTERLVLRQLTAADAGHLFDLDSDPEVMRFLTGGGGTPREEIERDILPRFLGYYARYDGFGFWAAIERASGDFLGWFSFRPHEGSAPGEVEIGYRLRRAAWGRGYATEGARALIRQGFGALGVRRVVANTYEHNVGSRRVLEKAGLTLVRRYRLTPADLATGDTFQANESAAAEVWDGDEVEYALSREDWERQETGTMRA